MGAEGQQCASLVKLEKIIVDFGCGTGLSTISAQSVLTSFEDWQVTGTDISTHMIMKARERGLNAIHNNEIDTVCKAVKFDALIACNVVHYFVGLEEFRFWSRLLSVDGIAVFNFRLPKINPNSKERESLFAGLRMAGFEPIRDYLSSIKTEKREYSPWIIVTRVMS
ncbi:MAG: class I SAM-dependent methyltransferase [Patescibacteria group bacterium]